MFRYASILLGIFLFSSCSAQKKANTKDNSLSKTKEQIILKPGEIVRINQTMLLPDDRQIFFGAGDVRFDLGATHRINPKWWGAKGDGKHDDHAAIQKAINIALASPAVNEVYLPPGIYRISKPLIVSRTIQGKYAFVGLTITGYGKAYASSQTLGSTTIIKSDFKDAFALGIQGAKGFVVKNIFFQGLNDISFDYKELTSYPDNAWSNTCRDKPNSPYAAIVIDPFGQSLPKDGGYPGLAKEYHSNKASTDIRIENCRIRNYVAGLMISPNGRSQNAEIITIRDNWIDHVKVAIAIGQSQSRSVYIHNLNAWGTVQYMFDTKRYGKGNGVMPEVNGMNLAGGVKYLFNSDANWTYGHFSNVYAESIYGIGFAPGGKLPYSFLQCYFKFIPPIDGIRSNPAVLVTGNASFIGSTLRYYMGPSEIQLPINFNVKNLSFYNCSLEVPPVNNFSDSGTFQNVDFTNTTFSYFNVNNMVSTGSKINNDKIPFSNKLLLTGQSIEFHDWFHGFSVEGKLKKSVPEMFVIEQNVRVSINDKNSTATWKTGKAGLYKKFDPIIVTDAKTTATNQRLIVRTCVGFVSDVNLKTGMITISGISEALYEGNFHIYSFRYNYNKPLLIGDLKAGSKNITNIISNYTIDKYWRVGDRIYGDGIERGTYISAIMSDHILLSHPAKKDLKEVDFYDADIQKAGMHFGQPTKGSWRKGDFVQNNFEKNTDAFGWVCTKSGIFGTKRLPVFREIALR